MSGFVKLDESLLSSEAWRYLRCGPRALYIELKRRFNGHNNGEIYLSHRDASDLLNVARNTVAGFFKELESVNLIEASEVHKPGPSGVGKATKYYLTELPKPVTREEANAKDRNLTAARQKRREGKPPSFDPKKNDADDFDLLDDEISI